MSTEKAYTGFSYENTIYLKAIQKDLLSSPLQFKGEKGNEYLSAT